MIEVAVHGVKAPGTKDKRGMINKENILRS